MREIKFRGFYKEAKSFIYSDDYDFIDLDDNCFCDIIEGTPIRTYTEDLQQFTGLKDRNGKEIYEGDIITFPYISPMGDIGDNENEYTYYGNVIFEDGIFIVQPIKADSGFWSKQVLFNVVKQKGYVIGNIHENPELLKGIK